MKLAPTIFFSKCFFGGNTLVMRELNVVLTYITSRVLCAVKLEFHGTDTDTDMDTDTTDTDIRDAPIV